MRKDIAEIYFDALAGMGSADGLGSYGIWEPDRWIWPGNYGTWRHNIFSPEHLLDPTDWGFRLTHTKGTVGMFSTDGVGSAEIGGKAAVQDLSGALGAGAEVSFGVSGAKQVLVWMGDGYWWEIEDLSDLKEKIRSELGRWDLGAMVVPSVFETRQGVIGISSRSTTEFVVQGNADGPVHLAAKAKAATGFKLSRHRGHRRIFPLEAKAARYPAPRQNAKSADRRRVAYSPFFRDAFRVSPEILARFGIRNRRLVTPEGRPLHRQISRSEPEDRTYDARGADMTLQQAKELPISELFESVSPQDLAKEFAAETRMAQELVGA